MKKLAIPDEALRKARWSEIVILLKRGYITYEQRNKELMRRASHDVAPLPQYFKPPRPDWIGDE